MTLFFAVAVGNVRVVINASELLCEVKIVDFSIVIKLHQLLKVIKTRSVHGVYSPMNMFT